MKTTNSIVKICLAIVLIIFVNACGNEQNEQRNKKTNAEQASNQPQVVEQLTPEQLQAKLEQQAQQRLEEGREQAQRLLIEQKQILEKELQFFDKPFDVYTHCKTEASIQNLLGLFGAWAALIEAREGSEDAVIEKLAKQLKNKVVAYQAKAFPILRQEYPKVINNKIRVTVNELGIIGGSDVEYVYMEVSGNKDTYTVFSWWGLISDGNKAVFQKRMLDRLTILRYTKAKLQSHYGDSESSYFTTFKGKDTDLIIL